MLVDENAARVALLQKANVSASSRALADSMAVLCIREYKCHSKSIAESVRASSHDTCFTRHKLILPIDIRKVHDGNLWQRARRTNQTENTIAGT